MFELYPLVKKELRSYFNSPVAYIMVLSFLVFMSIWFFHIHRFAGQNLASLRGYFGVMPTVFIVLIPALTMRGWAEERKLGTAELLLTLPYTESKIAGAKFLGAFLLFCIMIFLTLPIPLTVRPLGNFETGEIIGEYIGIIFLGASAVSIGLFVSALSTNQISAFIFGVLAMLFFSLVHQVNIAVELPPFWAGFFRYLSLDYHFQSFRKGLIDSRDLLYFAILTLIFHYLTIKVLVFRKWR
jgi:ABC-2 type transport system permease protein